MRKFLSAAAAVLVAISAAPAAYADNADSEGVVILHTNDVHCGVTADDYTFGYAELAAYQAKLASEGYEILLTDAGDFTQGDVIGTLSDGEYLIDIMNGLGYDFAAVGNHEFDYGMEQFFSFGELAEFQLLSCNFTYAEDGSTVVLPYAATELSGYTVGIIGVSTPQTLTSTKPTNFTDENGNAVYDFRSGGNGKELYDCVQQAADTLRTQHNADYIIALAHLGTLGEENPWTSYRLIQNTTGIDAVIDGHSHTVVEGEVVSNKDGEDVLLSSTGTKMQYIGQITIDDSGISAQLISRDEYAVTADTSTEEYKAYAETDSLIKAIQEEYSETINTVVAQSSVDLTTIDPENPEIRLIRNSETNLGNLCADAYRIMMGADCALINGGGVRADIMAGDVTYGDIISVNPFGNEICLVEATGQELLDALEIGVQLYPEENGSFFHVSGITFELHSYLPSPVQTDESFIVTGIDGERRVRNVTIGGEPIQPDKTYTLASHNYLIKSGGCECSMFMDNNLLADSVILDNRILIDYITEELSGVIGEQYSNPYGDGRITVVAEKPAEDILPDTDSSSDTADKTSPDTGIDGIYAVCAAGLVSAAALLLSRKK